MSHLSPGLLSTYNSLTDKHLAGYFSNTRIRRHLQRAGLITRSGRIVPDKEYRHKLLQRAHQRHVRECLAQAIFHKVLEMERVHQMEIKRKLEEFAKRERVHKIKAERSKRYEEDIIRILSPRPPTGTRCIRKQHSGPEGEHSESSESPGSSRPNTAPGKMQRPVRLKPIHSNSTTASLRRSSPYRTLESSNENGQMFNSTMDKGFRRRLTPMEASHCISPYCLPVINNFVTPVPPATKRKERGLKVTPSGPLRGRRLRPTTASSGADVNEDLPMLRSSVHQSRVSVNMTYFGKTVHLSHDLTDMRDEVKVFQQHCGGENLCVYKGTLHEGETFKFISRRHRGFPFSLTFFLNGLQVERLSSCCEFKHRKGSRLGGRHGHFGFSSIEGASPCYKCIIAMGLDKKPSPPPKRVKKDGGREESIIRPKNAPEMKAKRTGEDAASHSECETSQPRDEETQEKEETAAVEDKVRDEYEEDFEADDEGPVEDAEAKGKKSPSPSVETQRQDKGRDASETEDDDDDIKSHSGSSSSCSDQEESDAEAARDSREDEKAENSTEVNQEESVALLGEKDETATEVESAAAKDSDIQNSAGESTEIDISDSSVPSGNEFKQNDDTSGGKEAEKTLDESKQEEEQERAKSVQEKLAEAILKESQCSSEPELSDTSTEEEEVSAAVREKSVTFTEKQETPAEEIKCKEDTGETEAVVQDQEETSDPKEQEDETKQEPNQNSDSTEDEKVKIDEEVEKAASKENTAENNKSEDTSTLPLSEKEIAEDDKTSELQEDAAAKTTDAAEKGEEKEEKTAVEADTESDEAGHGAKRSEEDESLVSEPNKKSDEAALPDNAEAEAMTVSETMEMKAEPSEEQEALSCEEAPVTDTEERQQGDRAAESETEVTGENSDSTVKKTAETKENDAKDEMNKDDINEGEAEVSAVEAEKDDNQREMCDLEEEQAEKSKENDHKVEEKSEEESKEEEKQTNLDETTDGDNSEGSEVHNKDKIEEENNESKMEEKTENEETITDLTKTDVNTGEKANEQSEKTQTEEETVVAVEENTDEPEKTEKNESVMNENVVEESKEEEIATDKTTEAVTNTAADEEKHDEAEDKELDQSELKAEQSEATTNKDEESEERKVVSSETVEGGEISEIAEEPEKSADADLATEKVKTLDEKTAESEVVSNSEAVSEVHETVANEETLNRLEAEAEGVNKETEIGSDSGKNREIDAENGEISTIAENKTEKDEGEAQPEGKDDVKTGEHTEDEIKNEEITEDESIKVKEATVESEDNSEKHEEDKVEQASHTDVLENEAKEGDNKTEKLDESPINESEPETSGMGIKSESNSEDRKNDEKTEDENANISDPGHEHMDSDLSKKNDGPQSNVGEVIDTSLDDQKQSLLPTAEDLDDTSHKLDKSTELSKTEKDPNADENALAVDLSVADGENGDTEEASKPSEEGASVLLKPEAQTALHAENQAENTEQSVSVGEDTPEVLAEEDNTDLVTNWVTMHQASRFFETFIEPLEDLKESETPAPKTDKEAVQSTEMPRSVSPLKTVKISENAEQPTAKDVNESKDKTKEEAVESEIECSHSGNGEPCEKDPVKDKPQAEEETEVKGLIAESESELNKEQGGSLETDRVQDGLMQNNSEQTDISKTEVESIADIRHSVTSGKPGSVSENQTEEKMTDNGPDWNEKQTAEEMKDLPPSSETEEHQEHSTSPEGPSELKANELTDTDQTWEKSREVTEITDLTEDGSQEEPHHKETQPKLSDESSNGDRRDVQLIQDVQHTLSKDRLSAFSVDETLFGRSSYPLLAAARTESGH